MLAHHVHHIVHGLYVIQWAPTSANGIVPANPATILGCGVDGTFTPSAATQVGNGEQFALIGDSLVIRPNWYNGAPLIPNQPTVAYVIACRALA